MALHTLKLSWTAASADRTRSNLLSWISYIMGVGGWNIVEDFTYTQDMLYGSKLFGFVAEHRNGKGRCWIRTSSTTNLMLNVADDIYNINNPTGELYIRTDAAARVIPVSYTAMDLYVSVDDVTGTVLFHSSVSGSFLAGIVGFEQLPGDPDSTAHTLGVWSSTAPTQLVTMGPVDPTGFLTGPTTWQCSTPLGGATAFSTTSVPGGNDVIFPFYVSLPAKGKLKGKLQGPMVTTNVSTLTARSILSAPGQDYLVTKVSNQSFLMPWAVDVVAGP